MKSALKLVAVCLAIVLVIGLEEYCRWVRPFFSRSKQIANVVNFDAFSRELSRYHEQNGKYPLVISNALGHFDWFDGKDSWGNPLLYLSDGDMFIIVSLGSDGRPDGINYLAARLDDRLPGFARPCKSFEVDQIVSDRGWYRACGK